MEICLIGDRQENNNLWGNLLSNTFPQYKIHLASELDHDKLKYMDFVILLLADLNNSTIQTVNTIHSLKIPILCIIATPDYHQKDINKQLYAIGVKGVLDIRKTSMDILRTAIEVVSKGGIFIAPSSTDGTKNDTSASEPFDLIEWRVFSLISKGADVETIAITLHISEEEVRSHKEKMKIIYLTNSKD